MLTKTWGEKKEKPVWFKKNKKGKIARVLSVLLDLMAVKG